MYFFMVGSLLRIEEIVVSLVDVRNILVVLFRWFGKLWVEVEIMVELVWM